MNPESYDYELTLYRTDLRCRLYKINEIQVYSSKNFIWSSELNFIFSVQTKLNETENFLLWLALKLLELSVFCRGALLLQTTHVPRSAPHVILVMPTVRI